MSTPALPLLDELDELRAKATPGPWEQRFQCPPVDHHHDWDEVWVADPEGATVASLNERYTSGTADAALIVAAVNALPELLAEVRRGRALREQHDELRHRLKALVDEWDAMARNLHHIPVAEAYADVVIGLRAALASPAPAPQGGGQR